MPEIIVTGLCASSGLACGEIVELAAGGASTRTAHGTPDEEAAVLSAALETAAEQLGQLMAQSDAADAEIIEFQQAFALDDELSAPAFASIADGVAAHDAWNAALAAEIAGYQQSDDEYFRARVADLDDLRQRVLACMTGASKRSDAGLPAGRIVFAEDLAPSRFLAIDWSAGGALVLAAGSPNSHLAMLARSRGVPMVVGARWPSPLPAGAQALVDGRAAHVVVAPSSDTRQAFAARLAGQGAAAKAAREAADRPAVSRDGQRVLININIASVDELDAFDPRHCDGIGLFRTEFLFGHDHDRGFPDEDAQYSIYRRALAWADGRPVVIRTLDAGADKPIAGLTPSDESNPFLGVRGIRLSLAHPEILRVQLRALLRAAVHGDLRVMLPMVSVPGEVAAVSALFDEELRDLEGHCIAARRPPLGIMVEVPATAIAIDHFPADFYSIGSNDLSQYVMAAARDNRALASLLDPTQEALLRLVENVVRFGRQSGRSVSLCGEAAGDPQAMPRLLERGLRSLSVAPAALGRVKLDIAGLTLASDGAHDGH